MKNLKDYIKESILGDWEDIDVEKDIKSEIEQFLEDNYRGRFSIALVGGKYIVNSKTNVGLKNTNITSLTNGMFEFGKVDTNYIGISDNNVCCIFHKKESCEELL